jgi:hypothetical protein
MNGRGSAVTIAVATVLLGVLSPASAEASRGWRHGDDDCDIRWRRGRNVRVLSNRNIQIIVKGQPYGRDLHWGHRHWRCDRERTVGTCVTTLPAGHRTIIIDGVTYHEYDGAYYKGGPAGYTVVSLPVATSGVAVAGGAPGKSIQETVVINVPNANGSYMPVQLQLATDGTYIGPQGEVYPSKPELAQLQAMYGK